MNLSQGQFVFEEIESETGERVISVGEYIRTLNTALRPVEAVVRGEVNQVKERGVGVYFTLCDKEENAVLNCIVWRSRLNSMGIDLKEGMEVKVTGYAEVYAPYGKLSLKTLYIVPVGEGALKQAFEKLKKKLAQAGYFDAQRKRALPSHVQNIGLITADGCAAQKDFLTHIGNHGYKIRFYDVRVEGIKSVKHIVRAIRWFNEHTSDTEVLVLTRGGGSLESLQAFNALEVAEAIYSSKIPVLAAIGHEQDVTIADLVADVRASVPTHAGKMLGDPWEGATGTIDIIEANIFSLFRNRCAEIKRQLGQYQSHFLSSFVKRLRQRRKEIDGYSSSMMRCFRDTLRQVRRIEDNFNQNYERFVLQLKGKRQALYLTEQTLYKEAGRFYAKLDRRLRFSEKYYAQSNCRFGRHLNYLSEDLSRKQKQLVGEGKRWYLSLIKKIAESEKVLLASDPQLKLKQGFSIVKDMSGKVLKSIKAVKPRDIIAVQLYEGSLDAEVEKIR